MNKKNLIGLIGVVAAMTLAGCGNGGSEQTTTSPTTQDTSVPGPTSSSEPAVVTLTSISLSGTYKTTFLVNDSFTYEGLIVTAKYSDSTEKILNDGEFSVTAPSLASVGKKIVKVTYTEGGVSKSATYDILVDKLATNEDKQNAIMALSETFNNLDYEAYGQLQWDYIVKTFNDTIDEINAATYQSEVTSIKNQGVDTILGVKTIAQIVEGTWFDETDSSVYQFDRDEDNNLVILYDGYPGSWKHVGTNHLVTDINENNRLTLKLRNDGSEDIKVRLNIENANHTYKVGTEITTIAAGEVKVFELDYEINVSNLYLFLDSVSGEHTRKGKVTILEQKLTYEDVEFKIPEYKKTPLTGANFKKGDDGSTTIYTLTEEDKPIFIDRIDAVLKVDFNGNSNSKQWYGLHAYYGSNHISLADNQGHTQEIKESGKTVGNYVHFSIPVSENQMLKTGDKIHMDVSYAPETGAGVNDLLFEVLSYNFHYTHWAKQTTETIEVGQKIYENSQATDTIVIPYDSFEKTGRVDKMEVQFTAINKETYGKSQINFEGFDFTEFDGGNQNVLNVGSKLYKRSESTPESEVTDEEATTTFTFTLYPTKEVKLANGGDIKIACWWTSAIMIQIDSITIYTDQIAVPEDITSLEAHGIDKGVVLEWSASAFANKYDIYQDKEKIDSTTSTFYKVEGLENGKSYTFGVVAKNASGESNMIEIVGTPIEGGEYDSFIYGLNTDLERNVLGQDRINIMFEKSLAYVDRDNNERFLSKLDQMKNGQETTVAFMGGSITVGETATIKDEKNHQEGYAYWTYQWLKNNFDKQNKLTYVNGSISGTGSEIGIVRAQKDVLDYNPDIVFIEFAANNGNSEFYRQSYESLIRKCLALPSHPAVILTFSFTSYTNNGSEYQYMSQIGTYYQLPMFSLDQAMRAICTADKERTDPIFAAFTDDATHPNNDGHKLYAKCLAYYLNQLAKEEKDEPVAFKSNPSVAGNDSYENLVPVDHLTNKGIITELGSFFETDTSTPSTSKQSDVTAFQQGWKKTDTTVNEEMKIEVTAKNFIVIYEAGNSAIAGDPTGNIVVTYTNKNNASDTKTFTWDVSKTCKQNSSDLTDITVSGGGWGNPVAILLFNNADSRSYNISIKMENESGICTIMAFGYTA